MLKLGYHSNTNQRKTYKLFSLICYFWSFSYLNSDTLPQTLISPRALTTHYGCAASLLLMILRQLCWLSGHLKSITPRSLSWVFFQIILGRPSFLNCMTEIDENYASFCLVNMSTVPNFLDFTINAALHLTFIRKLCYKLSSIVTFSFIQIFLSKLCLLYCLLQRQNSHYFRCPVWKTKRW